MRTKKKKVTHHCHNCEYLEWVDGDTNDPSGFVCHKRIYNYEHQEEKHLKQLDDEVYRLRPKPCFISK